MSMFVHVRGEGVKNGQNLVHVVIERPLKKSIFTYRGPVDSQIATTII